MKFCVDILSLYGNNSLKINPNKFTCENMYFLRSKTYLQNLEKLKINKFEYKKSKRMINPKYP